MNLPGLKLVAPATPADAKALTKAAIRDDNPVVVFEHKLLYGRKAEVPDGSAPVERIGRAAIRRQGGDVTIAAALVAVEWALGAADALAADGIEADVIDLRSLRPLDVATIAESITHTGRLIVVEEGPPYGGYSAEVIRAAAEADCPVAVRAVTMPDIPIPFSGPLEDGALPSPETVAAAVRELIGHKRTHPQA